MTFVGKNVVPALMILASIWAFLGFMSPKYSEVRDLQDEKAQYEKAISDANEARILRSKLLATYDSFSQEEWQRLKKLLPDKVDDVRLILDISTLAKLFNVTFESFAFKELETQSLGGGAVVGGGASVSQTSGPFGGGGDTAAAALADEDTPVTATVAPTVMHGTLVLDLAFSSTYANFMSFLRELEKNLELVDIGSITLTRAEKEKEEGRGAGVYEFQLALHTYWLR